MQRALIWVVLASAVAVLTVVGTLLVRAPVWPDPAVRLKPPGVAIPESFGRRRIAIDPGHGARDNTGNRSAFCLDEQQFTLGLATNVARELERTGRFEVQLTRRAGEVVEYSDRVERAEAWGAELLVSLHSDVRGHVVDWRPIPGLTCPNSRDAPGFAVLFSDEGDSALVARRRALATALGYSLQMTNLLPYGGPAYAGDYAREPGASGVFVDRRAAGRRIYILRRPRMPSVLIETHNAVDDREARRWDEPETQVVFAAALASALGRVLDAEPTAARRAARL